MEEEALGMTRGCGARNDWLPLSFRAQSRNLVPGQPRPALGQPRCDVAGRAAPAVCIALGRGQGDFSTTLRSTRNDREEEALGMTRGRVALGMTGGSGARNEGLPLSFRAQSRNLVPGQPRPALGQPRCDVAGRAAPAVCTALGRGQGDFSTTLRSARNDREEEALGMTRGLRSECWGLHRSE